MLGVFMISRKGLVEMPECPLSAIIALLKEYLVFETERAAVV